MFKDIDFGTGVSRKYIDKKTPEKKLIKLSKKTIDFLIFVWYNIL